MNRKKSSSKSKKMILCREVWKRRIMNTKGLSEKRAERIVQMGIELTEHMQYQHVMIAFHKQDGTFCMEKGTLVGYEQFFHHTYHITNRQISIVYWNVEQHGWRRFMIENLLEWKTIV